MGKEPDADDLPQIEEFYHTPFNFKSAEPTSTNPIKLNLGCGEDYRNNWINVDINEGINPDLVFDLNDRPWPWEDNSVDRVLMDNVIEHLDDRLATLKELHRIVKPYRPIVIRFPHWNSVGHYHDPTHTKTIDHRMFKHELVRPMFAVEDVSCTTVRFGRLLPNSVALLAADHISHIVSSVRVSLRNRPTQNKS